MTNEQFYSLKRYDKVKIIPQSFRIGHNYQLCDIMEFNNIKDLYIGTVMSDSPEYYGKPLYEISVDFLLKNTPGVYSCSLNMNEIDFITQNDINPKIGGD